MRASAVVKRQLTVMASPLRHCCQTCTSRSSSSRVPMRRERHWRARADNSISHYPSPRYPVLHRPPPGPSVESASHPLIPLAGPPRSCVQTLARSPVLLPLVRVEEGVDLAFELGYVGLGMLE